MIWGRPYKLEVNAYNLDEGLNAAQAAALEHLLHSPESIHNALKPVIEYLQTIQNQNKEDHYHTGLEDLSITPALISKFAKPVSIYLPDGEAQEVSILFDTALDPEEGFAVTFNFEDNPGKIVGITPISTTL